MKPTIIANFKSNLTTEQVKAWMHALDSHPASQLIDILVAPSLPHLHLGSDLKNLFLTAQDVSPYPQGSYTGAVNATQLRDLGIKYCIVGHSERRQNFHETDNDVANKTELLLEEKITPIILLDNDYIHTQISALSDSARESSLFVYEPSADIGGTETASTDQIAKYISEIQTTLSTDRPILYGGSVNASNITSVADIAGGFIIGSASLDSGQFIKLLETFSSHG